MVKLTQGVLIAIEGIDGSGKTTQIKKVAQILRERSYQITITHEPNHNSPYYSDIKNKVKKERTKVPPEKELDWYIKDRKWDLENNILPALQKNNVVLVDRYYLSNAAYQGALQKFSPEYVLEKNSFAKKPDLWIILDVEVALGQSRLKKRDKITGVLEDHLEFAEFQEKVRKNYRKLANMDLGGKIEWIDASTGEEDLTQTLVIMIQNFLTQFQCEEI